MEALWSISPLALAHMLHQGDYEILGCCSTSWCEDYIPGGDPWKKKEVEQDRVRKKVAHRVKIQKLMPAPSSQEQTIVTSPELHSQHATPQLKAEKHSQYDVDALPDLV